MSVKGAVRSRRLVQDIRADVRETRGMVANLQERDDAVGPHVGRLVPLNARSVLFTGAFSASSGTAYSWAAGTLYVGDEAVAIDAGSFSGLTADTTYYCYWDPATDEDLFLNTTAAATAFRKDRVLMATVRTKSAGNASVYPSFGGRTVNAE